NLLPSETGHKGSEPELRRTPFRRKIFHVPVDANEESGLFRAFPRWHSFCGKSRQRFDVWAPARRESRMRETARMQPEKPLPVGTAMLSNIALSLLMWNIALRLVGLFVAA